MKSELPPVDVIRSMFDYDPLTGVLRWKVRAARCIQIGDVAGSLNGQGYLKVQLGGKIYQCHRIAWLHHHGEPLPERLDHRNLIKSDNRIENLRPATPSQNNGNHPAKQNVSSNLKGVCWHKRVCRWQAQIKVRGRSIYLGLFDTEEEAHKAYSTAAQQHFGEYWRAA